MDSSRKQNATRQASIIVKRPERAAKHKGVKEIQSPTIKVDESGSSQPKPKPDTNGAADASPHASKESRQHYRMLPYKLLDIARKNWFLLTLGLLILIASQVQVPANQQALKKTITTYTCVTLIFLLTGCTLDTRTLLQNYARWRLHLFVQLQCFLLTSAITFALACAAGTSRTFMDPGLLIGLVFLGTVATTISSNVVMTRQAQGNTALTVVQTTLGNFLGVFLTPALLGLYLSLPQTLWWTTILPSSSTDFSSIYRRVLFQLGLTLYLPLVIGQLLRHFFPHTVYKLCKTYKLSKLSSFALLAVLWQTYDQAFAVDAFSSVPGTNMLFIVFISMALFLVFFAIAFGSAWIWLSREDVVAVCYCVPAKGIAMAVPISQGVFGQGVGRELEARILIPIVVYQGLQLVFGAVLVGFFKRWVEKGEEKNRADKEDGQGEESNADRESTGERVDNGSKESV